MVKRALHWGYSRLGNRARKWLCLRAMRFQPVGYPQHYWPWLELRGFWMVRRWVPSDLAFLVMDDFRKHWAREVWRMGGEVSR